MDKNKKKKSDSGEEAKSVLLDGDDYLVLELLKWPGETDREAIQRILREAIEMPRLKEFVEKLGQQIDKMLGESRDFVTITSIENSLLAYKNESPGRGHYWPPNDHKAVVAKEKHEQQEREGIIELPERLEHVPRTERDSVKEGGHEENLLEAAPPVVIPDIVKEPLTTTSHLLKPKPGTRNTRENPRLIRELISGTSQLKAARDDKPTPKRYPKGSKEYEDEVLRLKQALEGPWSGY
ncbi:MAG: hypothetical protein M1301_00265 [Candidatus Thermoplasmatota archaeon]|jgi:hypothetical protein|nr:hypothetical protein [Candidatus Thermoplasmatota archaeon]